VANSPKEARSTARQPAPRPRLRLVRSVPATPEIAVELLYECRNELIPLFVRFHAEQGKHGIELDPDWDQLLRMTATGILRVVTVRDAGVLVGFLLNTVGPALFYKSTLHASTIAYWLDPVFRTGWFPVKVFRRNVELLREWGVKRTFIAADAGYRDGRMGKVFERLGYELHELHYSQVL
jgi:hypothetical protein